MDDLQQELRRIYRHEEPRWAASDFDDFSPEEIELYRGLPSEIRTLAEFLGCEEAFPHESIGTLYGPFELAEWNSDDGTFGQLRAVVPDYPYAHVIKIGDEAYLDAEGEAGPKGAVLRAIGHDLADAEVIAESLLAFLRQAGSYRNA